MRFTLILGPVAEDDLAEAWLNAADPNAVTQAAHRIEQLLRTHADTVGEVVGSFYSLIDSPLEVLYKILPDGVSVRVYRFELME